jgi:hypothetical protein
MTLFNKIKWILGILMIFVLIIATNLIDRNNYLRVKDSVVTIYEDRLVAKDMIYELLKTVHLKEIATIKSDSAFYAKNNTKTNIEFNLVLERFKDTRLTREEEKVLTQLTEDFEALQSNETAFQTTNYQENEKLLETISQIKEKLHELGKIQVTEGSRQMSISQRAMDSVELFTRIEIYILIALAIIIQIIVIYKPKEEE